MSQIKNVRSWIETTYGVKLESHRIKETQDLKYTEKQLSTYFNNAEPSATSTWINDAKAGRRGASIGKDGQFTFNEMGYVLDRSSTDEYLSTTGSGKKRKFSADETIRDLRSQGVNLPQNVEDPTSRVELIDALEVKAVERGLRLAIINMPRGTNQYDRNSFLSARSLNPNKLDQKNQFLDAKELILWAQNNTAQTKPFVKVELEALNTELKTLKLL